MSGEGEGEESRHRRSGPIPGAAQELRVAPQARRAPSSAVAMRSRPSAASSARPSASGRPSPSSTARRSLLHGVARERGDLAAPARARARRASPGSTISVTRPIACASCGVDRAAGEDQVERAAGADDPRQPLRAAVDQRDAPAALGAAEGRGRWSRPAGRTTARARSPPARQWPEIAAIVGFGRGEAGEAERAAGRVGVERLERLQVGAGAERLVARAGEDEHVGVVVGREALEGVEQRLRGRAVDRVVALGPVDRDERRGAAALVAESPAAAEVGARACGPWPRRGGGPCASRAGSGAARAAATRIGKPTIRMKPALVTTLSLVRPQVPSPPSWPG